METNPVTYTDTEKRALIQSMCCLLMNKVKLILSNAQKNRQLAANQHLLSLVELVAEHLIPQYLSQHQGQHQMINKMHNLCYLLASKVQAVFTSGVIKTCIDQNWDLKGYRSVLIRILNELGVDDTKKLQDFFDKMIQSQNLQSQSCIKSISHFIKNPNKSIEEDDLKNPIVSFQTSFTFVQNDIDRFRAQNMKYECFQVLHPWAYDLDQVDFKYVISKDQVKSICEALAKSQDAQIFWLSFFKSQLSASADEFISALKELSIMSGVHDFYLQHFETYKKFMLVTDFSISLHEHADQVIAFVEQIQNEAVKKHGHSALTIQYRMKSDPRAKSEYIDEGRLAGKYNIGNHDDLKSVGLSTLVTDLKSLDLRRSPFNIKPLVKQTHNLYLKFTNVDTEELKDLEIKIDGNNAQFKVGEGDANQYAISNDKKLWESQFMILSKNGHYFIRDLGVVHTSRIKVTNKVQLQLHQGALIDLGKVVHYHVNKLTHEGQAPSQQSSPEFVVLRNTHPNYRVDEDAMLRARPTWISADENKDLVQNEIMLEASSKQNKFSIGRSNRRDVEIKLKAVSADHCKIEYQHNRGWFIHEKEKDRPSSNGTFVFMKSYNQMDDHEPSDIIPLFNGMTISFINYELQVRIESKTQDELSRAVFEELDLTHIMVPTAGAPLRQESHRSTHSQQKQEEEVQEQQDPYQEEFQVTKAKKTEHEVHEEVKSHKSSHQIEEEVPKSQRSLHKDPSVAASQRQSQQSLHEGSVHSHKPSVHEEEVKDHVSHKESVHAPSEHNQSVHDEPLVQEDYDHSPKQISKKGDEDEPIHEIQRSYSKHHIGEAPEEASHKGKSVLEESKHSLHDEVQQEEEAEKSVHEKSVHDEPEHQEKSVHDQSVHAPSVHKKSVHDEAQEEGEHKKQTSEHHASQKSLHSKKEEEEEVKSLAVSQREQHNQSVHSHKSHPHEEENAQSERGQNQSVHHEEHPHEEGHKEELKSQKSHQASQMSLAPSAKGEEHEEQEKSVHESPKVGHKEDEHHKKEEEQVHEHDKSKHEVEIKKEETPEKHAKEEEKEEEEPTVHEKSVHEDHKSEKHKESVHGKQASEHYASLGSLINHKETLREEENAKEETHNVEPKHEEHEASKAEEHNKSHHQAHEEHEKSKHDVHEEHKHDEPKHEEHKHETHHDELKKDDHKEEHKKEHKNEHKEEHKQEHKNEPKDEHKEDHKNQPKDEHKQEHKEEHLKEHKDEHKNEHKEEHGTHHHETEAKEPKDDFELVDAKDAHHEEPHKDDHKE